MPDAKQNAPDEIDVGVALGSDGGISTQCFTIYVPNKDRDGLEIGNQRKWVLEAIGLLTEINGGASAMPPIEGAWLNESEIVWENPVVVYSFIRAEAFIANIARIREFLHRMGRETNQGEIAFEFENKFHRIQSFDGSEKK